MWLKRIIERIFKPSPGELAAREAERLWALDVYDPPKGSKAPYAARSLEVINAILEAAGWKWAGPYLGNGSPQWCGLFAATCWRKAGIDPRWLATFWASTLRLSYWFRYKAWNGSSAGKDTGRMWLAVTPGMTPDRLVMPDGSRPQRGDIVVVGDGNPVEGDHITVLVGFDAATGVFHTISGNGVGIGPDGKRREGIVKTDYRAEQKGYRVLYVYRPGSGDMLKAAS